MVLAIYFNARGFGYALFEGMLIPVDWGIKTVKGANTLECIKKAHVVLHMFQPSVLLLQDCDSKQSRCSERVREQIQALIKIAKKKGIKIRLYSRTDVRACFSYYGAVSKDEIAREVAKLMPEFAPKVPPMRRLWMPEHYQMPLFDALALVQTHYAAHRQP